MVGKRVLLASFLRLLRKQTQAKRGGRKKWKSRDSSRAFAKKYYQVTMAIHWSSRWTGGLWRGPLLSNRGVLNQSFTFTFAVLYILRAAVQKKVYSVGFTPRYHQRPL